MNNDSNLAGELISEMQKNNPPGVFNPDAMSQGAPGASMAPQMPPQPSPQLQQQFMYVLKQSPEIQQKFSDAQVLQQVLQNPTVMMNAISYFQQAQAQVQAQAQAQVQAQTPVSEETESDKEEDDEKAQYEDQIDDVDLMGKKPSFMDRLMGNLKEPLITTVIFIILTQPFVRDYMIKWIPRIADWAMLQTLLVGLLFFIIAFIAKVFFI